MNDRASLANQAHALKRAARADPRLPALLLLTDERRLPDPLAAAAALPPGAGVILRHYNAEGRERLGRHLARLCRRRGLLLLVAGDLALARRLGAAGVHLPEHRMAAVAAARRHGLGLVTVAAHSQAALAQAARLGADAALLSPVFATGSHPGAAGLGPLRFAGLVHAAALPVYALGGINAASARRLRGGGAVGLAAIEALRP